MPQETNHHSFKEWLGVIGHQAVVQNRMINTDVAILRQFIMMGSLNNCKRDLIHRFCSLQAIIVTMAIQHTSISVGNYVYPESGNALYWLMTMFVLGWIPLVGLYMFCTRGGFQVSTLEGHGTMKSRYNTASFFR